MSIGPARLFLLVAAFAPVGVFAAAGGEDGNNKAIPPHATFRGLTYAEWTATWWQAAFAAPVASGSHPLFTGGAFDGEAGAVFLSAPVLPEGSPTAMISMAVPSGTPVFFPIITAECSVYEEPPFHGEDEPELRACADGLVDLVTDVSVTIDGQPAAPHRVQSPLFQWGPVPADNFLGAPEGTISDAVSDGYFLMLPPLNVGVHHIAVSATIVPFGLAVDAEFIITVTPRVTFKGHP